MPRRKRSEEGAAQAGRLHWTNADKQVALEASPSALEQGPTKKEAPDGGLKGVEVPLGERAAILFKHLALGRMRYLFAGGKVTAEQSVELRCHPSRSVRIWERWLDIKAEVTGVIFEVASELLDGEGHPPSGKQWTDIIEKTKRAYSRRKELDKLRAQHAAAKKKARKQRDKEAAEGATADVICAQELADPNAKKMTKKQRKAKIAVGAVADDTCSEDEVGLDIDAAAVPPMKESWEPMEYKIFVLYGPPAGEACRLDLRRQYRAPLCPCRSDRTDLRADGFSGLGDSMQIKIHLSPYGAGGAVEESIDLCVGAGEQILQWVGYTACARLAYSRGEVHGRYVPQSILDADGVILDVDIVLNEVFGDGSELTVEYSDGPIPFQARWEGRPKSPPFEWREGGEVVPPHDLWLVNMDLKTEGLASLVPAELVTQDTAAVDKDLATVKEVLLAYAGALQMAFTHYESVDDRSMESMGKMNLNQFRGFAIEAKLVDVRLSSEKVDGFFHQATGRPTVERKTGEKVNSLAFPDFLIAICHLAYHRAEADSSTSMASYTPLNQKLSECITGHILPNCFKKIQNKLETLQKAYTPGTELLLKKGRRLTEQTLDSCQLKRTRAAEVRIDTRYLSTHLQRWGFIGKDLNYADLAMLIIFAKQTGVEPASFKLHPNPLDINYNEFERLVLAISYHLYLSKTRYDPFEEYLGETMDHIFKKAGVLLELPDAEGGES